MWTSSMVLSALSTATFPDSAWPTSGSRKPSRICSPRGCKAAPSAPFAHSWLYSPQFDRADSFIAYEGTHTDGPFISPLRYQRDNVTGNYTWHISEKESLGFKLNFGRNDFFSSGQIPLDLVADGQLDRFGYADPFDGGRVRLGTLGIYYRRDLASGDIFKVDGFLTRNSGPRTIWSLPNAFTSAFKGQDPVPQFKATAKWGNSWSRFSQSFQPAGRCRSAAYSQFAQLLLTINSGLMRDVTINFGCSRS